MKTKLLLVAITSLLLFTFISIQTETNKKLKNILIGTWSGSDQDQQELGLTKYWIKTLNKNGTFIVMFTSIKNCEVESHIEKGKWEVKDGLYHETFEVDGKTDIYSVEIIDDNTVKYKAKVLSIEFENKDYEFVETREE